MNDKEANDLRCYASEIIVRLYKAEQREQLELLRRHAERAIEEIARKREQNKPSDQAR